MPSPNMLQGIFGGICSPSAPTEDEGSRAQIKRQKSQCPKSARRRHFPSGIEALLPSTLRFSSLSVSFAKINLFKASLASAARRPDVSFNYKATSHGTNPALRLHTKARRELGSGAVPVLASDGCGGVYLISSRNDNSTPFAVFKPRDEEFMAPFNPRGYCCKEGSVVGITLHPIKAGFRIGDGAVREQAAYVLDSAYDHFSGVPATCLTTLNINGRETEGSLQQFISYETSAEDIGTLHFDVAQVQKIGLLDIRLFNTDRHAGNLLLSDRRANHSTYSTMTPIDHGFCLPSFEHLESATFDWIRWPQAMFPFHASTLDHIASIDVERDAQLLRTVGLEEECITTFRICSQLLMIGANSGRTLHEIGNTLVRDGDGSEPSIFEGMLHKARNALAPSSSFKSKREYGDALVDTLLEVIPKMLTSQPKKKVRSVSCVA